MPNSQPSGFETGAKVVCIDDRFPREAFAHFVHLPRRNEVYTVTRVAAGHHWQTRAPVWNLTLQECPPVPPPGCRPAAFLLKRFRTLGDFAAHQARLSHQTRRTRQEKATAPLP